MTGGPTYRLRIEAAGPAASRIADALDEADAAEALSISYFDLGNGRFEISALYERPPDKETLSVLIENAAEGDAVPPLLVEAVPEADWVTLSQRQRGPVRAGRFLVYGSHDRKSVVKSRFAIEIDASQAFGTAHHATTKLCLLALDELAKRGRPDLVLDLGTGSGILAIAAGRAFDRPVVATDNDPVAVEIAKQNVHKAGLCQQVLVFAADGLAHPSLRRLAPDLIVANILAAPLHRLAPAIAQALQPGGTLLLSGITADQAGALAGRYAGLGFTMEKRTVLDGWAALLLSLRK